jgi:hypothetical protein
MGDGLISDAHTSKKYNYSIDLEVKKVLDVLQLSIIRNRIKE